MSKKIKNTAYIKWSEVGCIEEFLLNKIPILHQRKYLLRKSPQSIHNENVCHCLENWHSGNFDRHMTLIYISKKSSSVSL